MKITEEKLEINGLHRSCLESMQNTYVNDDYSIRIAKAKTMDGWFVAIHNNFGHKLPDDPFEEVVGKLFSGYCTELEELNDALAACEFTQFIPF